ncbi:hypothetical protein OE88DRAFT_1740324 [Heliocybe sulcata]|uniref:Uncharacterized protein n=1 Tax=Heliocybe sulcata TaxID=5364 RepID=A0A5C3MJK0_9AGAM|nr:hypothetical protein OE88DRAFT_1740324 [Heliocybe sulcata]
MSLWITVNRACQFPLWSANTFLMLILTVMFLSSTAMFIIDVYVFKRFDLDSQLWNNSPLTPFTFHEKNVYNLLECIYDGLFGLNVFLADGLLVWRYAVFWNRSIRAMILPLILLILEISFGLITVAWQAEKYLIRKKTPYSEPLPAAWNHANEAISWLDTVYYMTALCVNIILSIAITWRLWTMLRSIDFDGTGNMPPSKYHRVFHVVLESGMIYSVMIIVVIVIDRLPSVSSIFEVLAIVFLNSSIAMVPAIVITLVSLGKTTEYTTQGTLRDADIQFAIGPSGSRDAEEQVIFAGVNVNATICDLPVHDVGGLVGGVLMEMICWTVLTRGFFGMPFIT